jgi:hypothetical protein
MGSLPKTQKLPRSQTRGLKQFEFLYGPEASGSPFCPDASGRLPNPMVVAEFLRTKNRLSIIAFDFTTFDFRLKAIG